MFVMFCFSNSLPPSTATEIGTLCRRSTRFWAVTTTCSRFVPFEVGAG